jgi:ABC-type dipeptide/oligopeptide/nickel transport system permease subunit
LNGHIYEKDNTLAITAEDLLSEQAPSAVPIGYGALILKNRQLMIGLVLFLAIFVIAIAGTLVFNPNLRRTGAVPRKVAPTISEPLGTTSVGQSVAAQMTEAIPNSIQVGLIAATLGTFIGAALGFISGYFGGWIDAVLRVLIDVFLSVPSLLFACARRQRATNGTHYRSVCVVLARAGSSGTGLESQDETFCRCRAHFGHVGS